MKPSTIEVLVATGAFLAIVDVIGHACARRARRYRIASQRPLANRYFDGRAR